jgi:hypothetical protein
MYHRKIKELQRGRPMKILAEKDLKRRAEDLNTLQKQLEIAERDYTAHGRGFKNDPAWIKEKARLYDIVHQLQKKIERLKHR